MYPQILEKQRSKLRASVPPEKQEKHRRLRQLEKEYTKRRAKYDDARLKATKARNEYLLCMEAANSSIQRYFVEDLSDIIDVSYQPLIPMRCSSIIYIVFNKTKANLISSFT